MNNIQFIFLTGKTRIGKDTFALSLLKKGTQIISLAAPLHTFFKEVDYRENRELIFNKANEIKREKGENWFCETLLESIKDGIDTVIVPDLRFKHEYEFFKNYRCLIINVVNTNNISTSFLDVYETEEIPFNMKLYVNF